MNLEIFLLIFLALTPDVALPIQESIISLLSLTNHSAMSACLLRLLAQGSSSPARMTLGLQLSLILQRDFAFARMSGHGPSEVVRDASPEF